jgi:rare lipoprotein A (peptidoglycan hydrolase)
MTRRVLVLLVAVLLCVLVWGFAAPGAVCVVRGASIEPAGQRAVATWYCDPARHSRCTRGHPWTELAGAAGPGLPYRVGERVLVRYRGRSVVVRLIDRCPTCGAGIDLYASAFRRLAPLSVGRIVVTVGRWP